MKWTTDKPTRPGFYFIEAPESTPIVRELVPDDEPDLSYWAADDVCVDYLQNDPVGMRYAGPIKEPSDAYDIHDNVDRFMAKHGVNAHGFVVIIQMGLAAYEEALRSGATFPHHR